MEITVEYIGKNPKEKEHSTIFTLSNGYFSIKGDLELEQSEFGTIVAGVYDYTPYFYREIINAPRVSGLYIHLDGIPFYPSARNCKVKRTLDLINAELRNMVLHDLLEYKSTVIVHGKEKNLGLIKFEFIPKFSGEIILVNPIETNTTNPSYTEYIRVKHYQTIKVWENDLGIYSEVQTLDGKYRLEFGTGLYSPYDNVEREVVRGKDNISEISRIRVEKGYKYEFIKYIIVSDGNAERLMEKYRGESIDKLVDSHRKYWKNLWDTARVEIEGDEDLELAINFNIFHLLQVAPYSSKVSIPARGLHGFGYRGHVFWDTEIYVLPFFIATFPEIAKRALLYRYNLLPEARLNAMKNGFKGAQYPWESADDGKEATPGEIPLDMIGERKIRIYTGEEEHHITADIAYSVDLYYKFTSDDDFMKNYGLEIIVETARFWASRVEKEGDTYVINRVIGADEYHEHVNNNFFTNLMARRNLLLAVKYCRDEKFREKVRELGVSDEEIWQWEEIARRIKIPKKVGNVYEEFDGYFELEDYILEDIFEVGEGRLPLRIRENLQKTKLVKQADVIAAMFLLRDEFTREEMESNFDYYIKRTTHASSLSMPPYAIVASWIGREDIAYQYLLKCANVDLENIYKNTSEGLHIATAGGVWQVIFWGLCGVKIDDNSIKIENPVLPGKIRKIKLKLKYRGKKYLVEVSKERSKLIPLE
ncbi:glycoside hydrolase family 65 protein [Pyrococcus sp. ST04]|uniref:glycoside hydrolase family 65 protein n=1 Tax=Pyrococcus sp. ST04 TaxID=1183377 RepID=UPI0002605D5C|nr:glycoside hydrolase family 65 protein [Pyrococcus sp. ST04]AFK23074.1 Kojibiose phosphorylase [Pyrococcus sp. ST04]